MDSSYLPSELLTHQEDLSKISRCVLVTDSSIFHAKSEQNNDNNVRSPLCGL